MSKVIDNIEDIASIDNHIGLSGITAYHLLQGNLAVDNTVTTQGFNTTLYTGNGSTQSINTGIDMSTQWGNTAEEKFGGLCIQKSRSNTYSWAFTDTVRGASKVIRSDTTAGEGTSAAVTAFLNNGITIGTEQNINLATFASWNFQTTHRITGTTNHGKAYTCHYNPFTGFTIVKYEGSGISGHEIPHHLGRKLGFWQVKNLSDGTAQWNGGYFNSNRTQDLFINAGSETNGACLTFNIADGQAAYGMDKQTNVNGNNYILYGWTNSYFDSANTLIGNYEIGVYQGTGASGNKVKTRGKPAWVMIKRLDSTGDWVINDNTRLTDFDGHLYPNLSNAEANGETMDVTSDGFIRNSSGADINASGGQYLYMVAYDTNSNGGGSYYPRATDTTNLNISNAIIPFANGIDTNGTKITTLSKNETISGLTLTAGKNYVYSKNDGTYGVKSIAPNYGKTNPANGGDFYDVLENKWYTSAGVEIPESRNYMNHIVYADNDGSPLYVEELPKIEYKDSLQVNSLNVLSGFNLNQTWQNVTSSRVAGVTYTNTTGKPIVVNARAADSNNSSVTYIHILLYVNNIRVAQSGSSGIASSVGFTVTAIVPHGATYKAIIDSNVAGAVEFMELR